MVSGVEFPGEENRGLLEDLVGLTQAFILFAQAGHFLVLLGGDTRGVAGVDLGLADPVAQRFSGDSELLADGCACRSQRAGSPHGAAGPSARPEL